MATMHSTALRDYFGRLFGANPNRVGNPPEAEQDPSGEALPAAPNPPRFPEVTIPHLEAEIAELEKRLATLGEHSADAPMLKMLLRNRRHVVARAKAGKFLLDPASDVGK